jgi:membrane dipeptidase
MMSMSTSYSKPKVPPEALSAAHMLRKRAQAIHEEIISIDTHVDFEPQNLIGEPNYTEQLDTQFDLPKMIEGGLDALFFVIYVGQTREKQNPEALKSGGFERAYSLAIEKFDAVQKFTRDIAPDRIELALTADDVRRIAAQGKKIALIGVENGYPIGEDISRVEEFYQRGARYLSLTHNGHNQLADSHTGERDGWKWIGLSPLGQQVVAEMNRLGFMIDVSHASKRAMMQIAAISKAPIIASHSSARALCDVSRNLDDEQLLMLENTGGVIQIVAYDGFVKTMRPDSPERAAALAELRQQYNLPDGNRLGQRGRFQAALRTLQPDLRTSYAEQLADVDRQHPGDPPASLKDVIDHVDYAVQLIGIDHVGLSSDFDGGGGVIGWNDASESFNVTLELVRRGYTEAQIAKLWGGNLLRVMEEVERTAGRYT